MIGGGLGCEVTRAGPPVPRRGAPPPVTSCLPSVRRAGPDLSPPPSCSLTAREWYCRRQRHVRMTRRNNQGSETHLLDVLPGTTYPQNMSQKRDLGDMS